MKCYARQFVNIIALVDFIQIQFPTVSGCGCRHLLTDELGFEFDAIGVFFHVLIQRRRR